MNGLIKTSPASEFASVGLIAVAVVASVFALFGLSAGLVA